MTFLLALLTVLTLIIALSLFWFPLQKKYIKIFASIGLVCAFFLATATAHTFNLGIEQGHLMKYFLITIAVALCAIFLGNVLLATIRSDILITARPVYKNFIRALIGLPIVVGIAAQPITEKTLIGLAFIGAVLGIWTLLENDMSDAEKEKVAKASRS